MALTEKELQDHIFDWLQEILPLWDGTGTRSTTEIVFVWHFQDLGRYKTPVLEGRITDITKIGRDYIASPDENGDVNITGNREFTLILNYFGEGAIGQLEKVANATEDPVLLALLQSVGVATVDYSPIIDLHEFVDTAPEERAKLEIRMRHDSSWTSNPNSIEKLIAVGSITGDISGFDTVTITVDTITA